MNRRPSRIRRASTWWMLGVGLHALWMTILVLWIAVPALEAPDEEWTRRHLLSAEPPPATIGFFRFILDGLRAIFVLAFLCLLIACYFTWGEIRVERRRKRGLCEKCSYPIGVSPVCTECGSPVARRSDV